MGKSKAIQEQITKLHGEIKDTIDHMGASGLTAPMVLQKHAQILDFTAQLGEISTRRLVRLTWALVILTAVLLFFAVALYEDAHLQIKRDQAKQHYQLQNPKSPEPKP